MKTLLRGAQKKETLKKSGKWIAAIVITAVITTVINQLVPPILPSKQPLAPNITTSANPNPVWNTSDTQTVTITVYPDFHPPYSNNITVNITNSNSYKCYMVLELEASAGFRFLPITDGFPTNVVVEAGYEYKNIMRLYVDDFAPQFHLVLDIPVYTTDPDTFSGTEQIISKVLAVRELR